MKPRSLRHRLEKAAKLLVTIQKHAPEVSCQVDEDRGEDGHLLVDFAGSGMSQRKLAALGKDLESKGYAFTKKDNPWLGQVTYTGKSDDKPGIVVTCPGRVDRVAIAKEGPAQPYTFKDAE